MDDWGFSYRITLTSSSREEREMFRAFLKHEFGFDDETAAYYARNADYYGIDLPDEYTDVDAATHAFRILECGGNCEVQIFSNGEYSHTMDGFSFVDAHTVGWYSEYKGRKE